MPTLIFIHVLLIEPTDLQLERKQDHLQRRINNSLERARGLPDSRRRRDGFRSEASRRADTDEDSERRATLRLPNMRTLRRALVALGLLAIAAYVGAAVYLMTQETRILFNAGAPLGALRPAPPFEQVEIPPVSDSPLQAVRQAVASPGRGQRPFAWIMQTAHDPLARPWVIFLHGNTANVASRVNIQHYEELRKLGLNVLAP